MTHTGFYGGRSYPGWKERFGPGGLVEAALGVIRTLGWIESWKVVGFDPSACEAVIRFLGAFEAGEPADEHICHSCAALSPDSSQKCLEKRATGGDQVSGGKGSVANLS